MTRRALATVCLSGSLEEKLRAAAAAGFDGVELFENDLIGSPLRPAEVRELAAELGLGIDLYQPFRDFEAVPAERLERNLARAEAKFAVMDELGADLMLVCSNVSAAAIDDDALAAARSARAWSCSAARSSSSRAAGDTLEHTSTMDAPSASMSASLASARRRLRASTASGTASKSRNGW